MTQSFFITGTGTEVGKTLVTAALCYQAKEVGYEVNVIKPIISGYSSAKESDITTLIEAQNLHISEEIINKISLYRLKEPISPDIAAKMEKKTLSFPDILQFCQKNIRNSGDICLIEGIGGAMVPLNENHTSLDLINNLNIPVILVAGTYLGALSHTLTTISAIQNCRIKIEHLIISESKEGQVSGEDFVNSIKYHTDISITLIPYIEPADKKWQNVPNLLHIIKGEDCDQRRTG
jgi:dethiobiotin synthetase